MKTPRKIIAILLLVSLSSCASIRRQDDQMCEQIVRFANSSAGKEVHSVELVMDWGGKFSERKNVMAEKQCNHYWFTPGVEFCNYLIQHTSTEFPLINFNRALRCLGAEAFTPRETVSVERLEAVVSVWEARGVPPDTRVKLTFSSGSSTAPPVLKFSVGGT